MKFKILALITGCICMCCLPCWSGDGDVCAKNSFVHLKAKAVGDMTLGKMLKKELIIGAVGIVSFGLGGLLLIPIAAAPPVHPTKFESAMGSASFTFMGGGALTSIGCLISAGVKLLM